MREVMSLRLISLSAAVTVACVGAFLPSPSNHQCHHRNNDLTSLTAEDWSKFMSVSDGASQNTGASDPFERIKKRPPRSMGGNTGMNYQASYPEAPNSDTYGPPSDYDYGQQNDASSSWQSQSQAASSSLGASAPIPYTERSSSSSVPNEDQTSPVWSSFMTVADGPEPIPDPVTRRREEEMARKREEERQWQQQQQQQQYGQQFQQYQQQYPNGGIPPQPYQAQMPPYGPPFAPFPMQQPPYNNVHGGPFYPPVGSPPFPASPFGTTGANDGTTKQNSAGGYDERGRPNPGDAFQEQAQDDRIQDENERARAVVQERMAKEMAKFESENGPSSEKSPSAWWEAIQAKQDAKDKTRGGGSSNTAFEPSSAIEIEQESTTEKSPSWASTLPQPSASSTGFNNPWRPSSQTENMESSTSLQPALPPPPGPILGPPDMNNAWTPDSDQAPDKAPGYWSQFMAVSDGTADTPKTYEEQKAEWERQQRSAQREQEELARQQEAARDPAVAARLETDLRRVQVEQQQAQDRARWEEERLVELEAELHEREVEQKRAHMSVDNESPNVDTEEEKAKKRLEQAELMARKLVEQEVERAAAVARYRDLRNQVEAERQFRAEEEAREHARSKAEKGLGDDADVDAIDVDAEEQDISDSISTLETLMKALEETKRQIEEERKKAKYNEKAKASAAAEEWEAAVARARAKIMAEEIISTRAEEPMTKDDGDDKAYSKSQVDSKSEVESINKPPTVDTILDRAASSEVDVESTKQTDERLSSKNEEANTVVLNGVTIVTDSSTPGDTSTADSRRNTGPKATVDGISMTSQSADRSPFKFFESAKAMENGRIDPESARIKADDSTTPSDSKRQYFANRIEETRKRAVIESEKRRAGKVQPAKDESTVKPPVAAETDGETDTHLNYDAKEVQGEGSNFEYFANRIAESRKRALLSSIESATSSSDSSIFIRTKMDKNKVEDAKEDIAASSEPSTGKTFTPNRLEERKKLALLATLLQELPELINDDDDANPDEVERATQGLQEVILKNPFIKRNGNSASDRRKNGTEEPDSPVAIETQEAPVSSSRGPRKKNGSRKSQAGRTNSDAKVSSEADFEDVKKIFEETANKLGTSNGKVKANGSSPSLIRTIGKSTNGKNETGVDNPKVQADNSSN